MLPEQSGPFGILFLHSMFVLKQSTNGISNYILILLELHVTMEGHTLIIHTQLDMAGGAGGTMVFGLGT